MTNIEKDPDRRQGNSKLVAKDGQIAREQSFTEGPISVRFRGLIMSPAGEIQQVEITRDGNVIGMTTQQAKSLATEILRRLGDS